MTRKLLLSMAGAAAMALLAGSSAQAVPATSALKAVGAEQSNVTEARFVCRRSCSHRRHSRRYCVRRCHRV